MKQIKPQVFRAAWIAPILSPPFRNGAIACENGMIKAVGSSDQILSRFANADVIDLGDAILLPGLINSHTHLELSNCSADPSPGSSFVEWIKNMRTRSLAADFAAATQIGIEQSLRFGVTCVGDITQQIETSRATITKSPLRAVSFGEVLGLAQRRGRFDELFPLATDARLTTDRLRIGISPHAPYTVDLAGYRQCVEAAKRQDLPLATHLAETIDEQPFLVSQSGPFRLLWETIGSWQEGVPTFHGSPIEMAKAIGLLDLPAVLAHVNYCSDAELDLLSTGRASVIYCPRTHAYFKHRPHRWREMLARGINVALGTDSCASSPDLNLVDDLRLLRTIAPEVSASTLWELVTFRAAKALSAPHLGALAAGYQADFVAFAVTGEDPLEAILKSEQTPMGTWISGTKVH